MPPTDSWPRASYGDAWLAIIFATLLVIAGSFAAGLARFRQALQAAPSNLITTINLAGPGAPEARSRGHRVEADRLLLQVIEVKP